jgi:transcription termination factor NusA
MTAELLYQQGFKSAEEVSTADLDALLEVEGIGEEKANAILQAARDHITEKAATAAKAAETAETSETSEAARDEQ